MIGARDVPNRIMTTAMGHAPKPTGNNTEAMPMTTDTISDILWDVVARGVSDYMTAHHLTPTEDQINAIDAEIRATIGATLTEARNDAADAYVCGMTDIAAMTMGASFKFCGIKAAKKIMGA
jgi:hypothetical protein